MSDNFVFDIDAGSGDEVTYDAPPRTTPRGTEMLFFFSEEAESGIDKRSAYPSASDVDVADAYVTAFVGDGRLADVRRRHLAQQRANAIVASGALGMPAAVSRVAREAREMEESVAQASSAPRTPDLREKLRVKRAAATKSTQSQATPKEASDSASNSKAIGVRSVPVTASETGESSSLKKAPEAAGGRKRRRGKKEPTTAPSEALTGAAPVARASGGDDAVLPSASAPVSVSSVDSPSGRKQRRIEKARKRARKAASDRRRKRRNKEAQEKAQIEGTAAADPSSSLIVTFAGEGERTPAKTPATFGARDVRLIDAASTSSPASGPAPQAPPRRKITRPSIRPPISQGRQHRSSNDSPKPSSRGKAGRGSAPKGLRDAQLAGIQAAREREAANPGLAATVRERWAPSLPASSSSTSRSAPAPSSSASSRPSGVIASPLDPDLRDMPPLVPIDAPSSHPALPSLPPSDASSAARLQMVNALLAEQRRVHDTAQENVRQLLEVVLKDKKP